MKIGFKMRSNFTSDIEFALWIFQNPKFYNTPKVQQWLSVEEHQTLYDELACCRESILSDSVIAPNVDAQWRKLHNKTSHCQLYNRLYRWGVAASVAVVAIAVIFGTVIPSFENVNSDVATIVPSGSGFKLMTTGGQELKFTQRVDSVEQVAEITYDKISSFSSNENIKRHKLIVPQGSDMNVVLADGTRVWLNSGSEFTYPVSFEGNERVVELHGEGYFSVAHDALCPFIVKSSSLTTRVLGTQFNIRAYDGQTSSVTLVEGSVAVSVNGVKQNSVTLKPGENAMLLNTMLSVHSVDVLKYTSWKDGYFYYDNERLDDIIAELSSWYGFTATFLDPGAKELRFKLWVERNDDIYKAIERLNETGIVHIEVYGKFMNISK